MASVRAARRAAITAGSSDCVGGCGAGVFGGATGGTETGGDTGLAGVDCAATGLAVTGFAVADFAETDFAVTTCKGFATAAFAAGGATAAFTTGFLRITTTGLLFVPCTRFGIAPFFLGKLGKSILNVPISPAVETSRLPKDLSLGSV